MTGILLSEYKRIASDFDHLYRMADDFRVWNSWHAKENIMENYKNDSQEHREVYDQWLQTRRSVFQKAGLYEE